jgi:hypothetical protein
MQNAIRAARFVFLGLSTHAVSPICWLGPLAPFTKASLIINYVERLRCYISDRSGGVGRLVLPAFLDSLPPGRGPHRLRPFLLAVCSVVGLHHILRIAD